MNTALLLIDVQESFRHRPYFQPAPTMTVLDRINDLVAACIARDVPVVRVLHVEPGPADNPFSLASGHVRPMQGLRPFAAALEVHKSRHSALVGSGLPVWLREQRIQRLIVAGIRTEQCCETTTRHASDEGFAVDFVPDATLTFDMTYLDGRPLPAADIVARTVAVLKDRFATICSPEEAIARAT